ncbi:MAG: hypothetical protein NTW96_16910, partial [Planctomycetia bacterium]|nr:hypothetical protein [Planctomycetia bacterium]
MARLDKTATDYVAIALSPVLIMLMVGSLMYFLVAVFYRGCFEGRIYWILSCYTLAIVLIARISIEEGQERATIFGAALAMAAGFAVMRMSDVVLLPWLLLALVWWAADKLTWDCTLIDEDEDSSGRGLLQIVGLNRWKEAAGRGLSRFSRRGGRGAAESPSRRENGTVPLATRDSASDGSSVETATKPDTDDAEPEGVTARAGQSPAEARPKQSPKRRPHAPGVWIVYFSLAALPLFGLGQLFIPSGDIERRRWAFQLLCVYVASGLGLLLTTSFLGLRRYLRRRGVEMQDDMARVWIALGAAIIVVLLFVAALLPRPAPEIALSQFPIRFTTPQRDSSRYAFGSDGADANAPDSQSFAESDVEDNVEGERAGKSGEQGASEQGKSEPGKSEQRQPRTSDSGQRNQMEGEPADKGKSPDDQKDKSAQSPSNGSQSDQGESGQTEQNEQGKHQAQGQPEEKGESPERGEGKAPEATEDDEPADRQQQGQTSSENVRPREQEEKQSRAAASTRRSPPASPPRQPSGSGFRLPRLDLALGGLLKL